MAELDRPIKRFFAEPRVPADALWRRIEAQRGRTVRARRAPALLLATGVAFGLGVLGLVLIPRASGPGAEGPLQRADGAVIGSLENEDAAVLAVALSDGSRIELEPGARLVTQRSDGEEFRASVERGTVHFDVRPRGPRRFIIAASDTQVEVIGTRFSVQLAAGRVSVEVERGRVSARGPRVPRGVQILGAGERLVVPPEHVSSPPPAAAPSEPSAPSEIPAAASAPPAPERSADDLLADADAARLAGDYGRAARLLRTILNKHPDHPRAPLVALTLGRVQLDQLRDPRRAAAAFALAERLGLPRALAEEGAARLVEAYAKAGEKALARAAAERYRARFEGGPRAADVASFIQAD